MNDKLSEYGSVIISVVALLVFLIALAVAWIVKSPALDVLLGVAGSNATTVVQYWLGSSRGSQKKDAVLAKDAAMAAASLSSSAEPGPVTPPTGPRPVA